MLAGRVETQVFQDDETVEDYKVLVRPAPVSGARLTGEQLRSPGFGYVRDVADEAPDAIAARRSRVARWPVTADTPGLYPLLSPCFNYRQNDLR